MSQLPGQFTGRWNADRSRRPSYEDAVCWHLLLGGHAQVQAAAAEARQKLAGFAGLHMTPPQWLHVTVLRAGTIGRITEGDMEQMIASAQAALARMPPVTVTLRHVLYYREAIALSLSPASALAPVRAAARAATRGIPGADVAEDGHEEDWRPHLTICYSTTVQQTAPVIAALGMSLPAREVTIREMTLIVQQGHEPLWDWRIVGSASLLGSAPRAHG